MITVTYGAHETHVLCECGHLDTLPPLGSLIAIDSTLAVSAAGRTCNGCGRMHRERRVVLPALKAKLQAVLE